MVVDEAHRAPSPADVPVIRYGSQRWFLPVGIDLTFGRGEDQGIRFGHDLDDDLVSRRAGVLTGDRDGVLIRTSHIRRPSASSPCPDRSSPSDPTWSSDRCRSARPA
jgi:hypothetical protein